MPRPRIRTIKPEMWADEKIGDLSHGARLLFVGLITMADDEGRLRALSSAILGHVFPYDEVTPAKLKRWVGELSGAGLIVTYKVDEKPYIAFRHWRRHQKINRPTESVLPAPPNHEIVTENSVNKTGEVTEDSLSHAQARGSDPIRSGEFEDWIKHYVEVTGYSGTTGTRSAREAFTARRREGFTVAQLKQATVGCHADDYNREHHHDVPDTILRASKVTRYIKIAEQGKKPSTASPVSDFAKYDRKVRTAA